jgi:hypothetical protein
MRSQLENNPVLDVYFLSSLVGYSVELICIVLSLRIFYQKCNFGFARYLPHKQREFAQLGEIRFKMQNTFHVVA